MGSIPIASTIHYSFLPEMNNEWQANFLKGLSFIALAKKEAT